MKNISKNNKIKKYRRTPLEIEEEQSRTLYIRLPHTIKDKDEIRNLLFGDYEIKCPRQSSRHCHVIFPSVEDKVKNLEVLREKVIDGKPVFVSPPRPMNLEKKKKPKQKKIVIPEPKDDPQIGKYLLISNIPRGIKASEVKSAFPGSVTIALLKVLTNGSRQARLKMSSTQLCLQYLKNKSEWPTFGGKKVSISLPRKLVKKNKQKAKLEKLLKNNLEDTDTSKTSENA